MHTPYASRRFSLYSTRIACILLLSIFTFILDAYAQESVEKFESTITINKDGSMHVRESITVHAEGNQIKKGRKGNETSAGYIYRYRDCGDTGSGALIITYRTFRRLNT